MDLRDTPDEARFREELSAWLAANVPDDLRGHRGGAARYSDDRIREWSRELYEAGYIGLTWPKEYGGGGAPYSYQAIYPRGDGPRRGAAAPRGDRPRHGRADDHRARHRGAEGPLPAAAALGRRRSGARASPSRTRAPISPPCGRARASRAPTSSSTARRCGRRTRTSPTGASSSRAAIPTPSGTRASRT